MNTPKKLNARSSARGAKNVASANIRRLRNATIFCLVSEREDEKSGGSSDDVVGYLATHVSIWSVGLAVCR